MLKPIRIKLPSKDFPVYRTRPLTVGTFRDLLLIRHKVSNTLSMDGVETIEEVLEDLFPDAPKIYRPYIFLLVYCDSRGVDMVHVNHKCKFCGSTEPAGIYIRPSELKNPIMDMGSYKIKSNFIDPTAIEDLDFIGIFENSVESILFEDSEVLWTELDTELKNLIIDSIDFELFVKYVSGLSVIPKFTKQNPSCCEDSKNSKNEIIEFGSFFELYSFLLNPDEISLYYRSNKVMISSGYSLSDIEGMVPMEKSITLKLIEGELRRRSEANGAK